MWWLSNNPKYYTTTSHQTKMPTSTEIPVVKPLDNNFGIPTAQQPESCNSSVINLPPHRQRWNNRASFILAGMGAAIGLCNVWRFPHLVYKHGGASFLVPYFLALLFFGLPLAIMELAFGQKYQRGDIGVFRGLHPRLSGIGLMSVFCGVFFKMMINFRCPFI